MERSHLSVGDDVAIWSAASSVPVDPYNDFVVPFIVRATVLDRSPAAGGVEVEVDGAPRHAASRAVICHWSDYLNRRAGLGRSAATTPGPRDPGARNGRGALPYSAPL